jgi:hypothetical protein
LLSNASLGGENVADNETTAHNPPPAAAPIRRAPARRKASAGKTPARRKKTSPRRRPKARTRRSLSALLDSLAKTAASAGKGMKTLSGQGSDAARRALQDAGAASKKTIGRLTKEWERMDTKRRTQFVAALLAALAAASAPIVRARLKK